MAENDNSSAFVLSTPPVKLRRSQLPILILAVLFVSATFLTWYFTWFGRDLNDSEITRYLADDQHPRHVQHALLQIQQRLDKGDSNCRQWYPKIIELAAGPEIEFRLTAAWAMGYDNTSEEFHRTLLKVLSDQEPLVRRNGALALIRFNDASGRPELLATLRPYSVVAPAGGVVSSTLNAGSPISRGTLLARVRQANSGVFEIRSPMPGSILAINKVNEATVSAGDTVLQISADTNSLWDALRGLALIGRTEDVNEIERYAQGVDALPDRIKAQAALTARAIQSRVTQKGQESQALKP